MEASLGALPRTPLTPNARCSAARDVRCLMVFEWASTPKWRKLTRGPSVGGQTPSRRQPVIPVLRRSQLEREQARRVKSAPSARFRSFAGVPGLRVGCRSRRATPRSTFSLRSRLKRGRRASPIWRKPERVKRRREFNPSEHSSARATQSLRAPRRWKVLRIAEACVISRAALGNDLD